MKQHHTIEIFSGNCPLCKHVIGTVEAGKCAGCNMTVYDVNKMSDGVRARMKAYDIKSVPTVVIDGEIKVVGIPDFPWICSEDLYKSLRKSHGIRRRGSA